MPMRRPIWMSCLVLGLFLLASCGTDDADSSKKTETKPEEKKDGHKKTLLANKVTPICPQVAIIRDLDTFADYANETPEPNQLVSAAKLTTLNGDCEYQDSGIDVAFNVNMVAKRGPRLGGLHAGYPIFVAVVDPGDTILNKDQMTSDIGFSGDNGAADHTEALHVFIPLPQDQQLSGPLYRVLVGFQLSPAQASKVKSLQTPP